MLFDLRSRGRRTTVRAVYLTLAIVLGLGLILFGVGTGVGGGGLLNAFNGSGSGNSKPVVSQAQKSALAATRQRPNDPQAWSQLVQAYDAAAKQEYNPNTGAFTATGQQYLKSETQAFQRYLKLAKHPDSTVTILGARAYQTLADYAGATKAWEATTAADPTEAHAFQCLAVNAYAAKQTRIADLATAKALSMAPKLQRPLLKERMQAAKSQPQIAQTC